MGVPECQLEEESEPEWCEVHGEPLLCAHCEDEAADRQFETQRERKGETHGLP